MFGFFVKRPGLGLLAVLAVFVGGGVMAHRSSGALLGKLRPMSIGAKKNDQSPRRAPTWQDDLDLDRAEVRGGKLVQALSDGSRAVYTIDPELQSWAVETLKKYEIPYGAMVMSEVRSGRVLVLAGASAVDPTVDVESLCLTPWAPAASVFKLVTASALLAKGVPPQTNVCYHGGLRGLNASHIKNNPKLDTTCRSLSYAIAKSVNPIMAKLALRYLGSKPLQRWAERLGFNRPIPFELPVKPSRAEVPREKLELARVAAGFWHTEISPLHGAALASVAAGGGVLRWPHVVQRVERPGKANIVPRRPTARRVLGKVTARRLGAMMARTTTIGTARKAFRSRRGRPFLGEVKVAGKTGSLSRKDPFLHYNWFVGYAPVDRPQVAFAVLLGNPARWRIKAHVAARMMLQRYFEQQKKTQKTMASNASKKPARL